MDRRSAGSEFDSYSYFGEGQVADNGFAVLVPMRRGRGLSEGVYGEATYGTSRTGQIIDVCQSINETIGTSRPHFVGRTRR